MDIISCKLSAKICLMDVTFFLCIRGKSFRRAFQHLKEIGSFFPDVPRLALSATISIAQEKEILQSLGMTSPNIVRENPDRENIYLSLVHKDYCNDVYKSYENIYKPLCDELLKMGNKFPVTLLYMPLQYLGNAAAYCRYIFNNPSLDTCIFGVLCSGQDETVKSVLLKELCKEDPRVCLIFCTSVLGMGFDSPSIVRVIHSKPPRNLADYIQEFGRAGRAGQSAEAVLYYCKKDLSANLKDLRDDIISYCNEKKCLRENLLQQFGYKKSMTSFSHSCCSYCRTNCKCFECEMLRIEL